MRKRPSTDPPLQKGLACSRCKARKVRCTADLPACAACLRSARFRGHDISQVVCGYEGVDCSEEISRPKSRGTSKERRAPKGPRPQLASILLRDGDGGIQSSSSGSSFASTSSESSYSASSVSSIHQPAFGSSNSSPTGSTSSLSLQLPPPFHYEPYRGIGLDSGLSSSGEVPFDANGPWAERFSHSPGSTSRDSRSPPSSAGLAPIASRRSFGAAMRIELPHRQHGSLDVSVSAPSSPQRKRMEEESRYLSTWPPPQLPAAYTSPFPPQQPSSLSPQSLAFIREHYPYSFGSDSQSRIAQGDLSYNGNRSFPSTLTPLPSVLSPPPSLHTLEISPSFTRDDFYLPPYPSPAIQTAYPAPLLNYFRTPASGVVSLVRTPAALELTSGMTWDSPGLSQGNYGDGYDFLP